MSRLSTKIFSALVVAGFATVAAFPAQAATCTDPAGDLSQPSIAGNVVTNAGCELGTTQNDSEAQVSLDSMFGFTDWELDARDNDVNGVDTGPNLLNLVLTGGQLGGDWSIISTAFSIYDHIMLVFKDGQDVPDTFVGYLLNSTSGTYTSPFVNSNNGNLKNISHATIYGGGDTPVIPLPAALPLFGTALIGLGFIGRRRKRVA